MKKKLVLITTLLFISLGVLTPSSVSAESVCSKSTSPAVAQMFSCASVEVNGALYDCPVTTINGTIGILSKVGSIIALGQPYDDVNLDICKETGKAPGALSRQEITAYFQSKGNNNGGAAGILATLNNGILEQRPASGVDFVSEKVYAITNPGKVYAADNPSTYYPGPGSELLRPIQGFWGWSVNLVFGFLILLIIVIAFAIMFRQRLGGAAEVTIQSAIPSIALAMILIPLSYAISGLFIDAITIGTNAVHGFLLGPQSPGSGVFANRPNKDAEECDIQNTDLGQGVECDRGFYADDPLIDVWRARDRIDLRKAGAAVGEGIDTATAGVPGAQAIYDLIGGILRLLPGDENTFSEFAWFGNIINIIIGILTIWTALKIFFRLMAKYLTMIIYPAFSPFVFATAALPGTGTKSIMMYLKTLGSASLFYIVTYAMFLLTLIFTDPTFQASLPDFRTSGYIPPLLGIQQIVASLASSANAFPLTQLLMTLVGIGIYFSIPKTLDSIDDALGTKFVLPQFIKTPLEAMQESFNIATRAFPAAAARVTRTTAAGVRGVAGTAYNAPFNIRRFRDKAYGYEDGDFRSATYQRRQANTARRQKLLADLDAADGQPFRRAQIASELAALDASESLQGKEFSTKGEEGKDRKIKGTFQWLNPNDLGAIRYNFLKNDQKELEAFLRAPNPSDPNNFKSLNGKLYIKRTIAKLVIEPENFEFAIGSTVSFAGVDADARDGVERYKEAIHEYKTWDTTTDIIATNSGGDKTQGFEYGNGVKIPGVDRILIRATKDTSSTLQVVGGKKIEILFDILIDSTFRPGELFTPGTGILAKGIQSPKRAVKSGSYSAVIGRMSVGVGTR